MLGGAQRTAGKRLVPILAELVLPVLRSHGESDIDHDTAALLV
jgi:hypothetical protein